ncbi:MAG: protein translocase subunit SecF [Candidatus Methylomirabilales bacterium]
MEIIGKTQFDFIGLRRGAFVLSTVLVLLGVVAAVQIARGQANLGIEFSGGTAVQVRFERPVDLGRVRQVLSRGALTEGNPQQFAGGRRVLIRIKHGEGGVQATAARVLEILREGFSGNAFVLESSNEVGPVIGRELQRAALWAILISLIGIVSYIAWRFEFRFGIAAAVATFHDVLVVLGLFFILGREITLLTVTALLTLAGYSLTDTVVVFDRIRENLRGRRRGTLAEIMNVSINETLSRTIMTSITTLAALLAILILGGEVLRDFALALTFGIVVGSYSSVFVASPIVYEWRVRGRRRRAGR